MAVHPLVQKERERMRAAFAGHLSLAIRAHMPDAGEVLAGQTTTGSEQLQVEWFGTKYNITITRDRAQDK